MEKYQLGYIDHKAYFCLSKNENFIVWGLSSEEKAHYFEVSA